MENFSQGVYDDENPGNKWNTTPLHQAVNKGHLEICRLFLMELKDKNPRDGINRERLTPFHYAARRGHLSVVKLFIH